MIRIKNVIPFLVTGIALVLAGTVLADPGHQRFAWDSAVDPQPEAVGDVLNSWPHAGSSPLPIGQDGGNGDVYVADLFTGFYSVYAEGGAFIATFAHPFGTATTTGITFNDDSGNSLFICTAVGDTCIETTLTGAPIGGAFLLANPGGGLLAGMAYDSFGTDGAPSIWYMDIVNDTVIEGAATNGAFKSSWGPPCPGPGACFGNGLDATNCGSAPDPTDHLDVLGGDAGAGQVTDILVTDQTGGGIGSTSVLPSGDTFVNDVVRDLSYLGGVQAVIYVGNASNTIFVGEAFPVPGCGGDGGDDGGDGEPFGACCQTSGAGGCVETTEAECNGTYQGDGVPCAPGQCGPVTPASSTWGIVLLALVLGSLGVMFRRVLAD